MFNSSPTRGSWVPHPVRKRHIVNGVQLFTGLLVVGFGASVYLVDRPVQALPFLGMHLGSRFSPPQFISETGLVFPAFAHTLGFALLTAAVIGRGRGVAFATAAFWGAVNLLFEVGQHSAVAPWIAGHLAGGKGLWFIGDSVRNFLLNGTFDAMDVLAIAAGAVAAYVMVRLTQDEGGTG